MYIYTYLLDLRHRSRSICTYVVQYTYTSVKVKLRFLDDMRAF